MKTKRKSYLSAVFALFSFLCAAMALAGTAMAQQQASGPDNATAAVSAVKPLIVWYSRAGHSQLVAETLQKQLGCDIEKIVSNKDRGFFSIVNEQIFGADDEQEKCKRDLISYNAVIIAAPFYFMKLCAPARTFMELNRQALKGKDLYLFVTLGGKLPEGKVQAIKEYGAGLGLNIKGVFFLQIGKQDEFPQRVSEILKTTPLQTAGAK